MTRAEKSTISRWISSLNGPYPLLLNDLAGIYILDKEWMEANGALKPGNIATGVTTAASTTAIGTGPFKVESYKPDAGTNFVVNPGLVGQAAAQPHPHRVQAGEIGRDARRSVALGRTRPDRARALAGSGRIGSASGFKVIEEPSLRLIMLSLNFRPELKAMPGQKNPLLDAKVRQAMWQAIDIETIKKRVMRDKSRNTGTLVAPPVPGYAK